MWGYEPMHKIVPPGRRGLAAVEHMDIADRGGIHDVIRGRGTANGQYVRLLVNDSLLMSDTDFEKSSNLDAVLDARGDVLVGGLGVGMILPPMLKRFAVHSVLVIEQSPDVIALVAPHLERWAKRHAPGKLTITQGDVFTWRPARPGRQFDFIYMDIWPTISTEDLKEHAVLHRRYQHWLRPRGRVTSWQHEELKAQRY